MQPLLHEAIGKELRRRHGLGMMGGALLVTKASSHVYSSETGDMRRDDAGMEVRLDERTHSAVETRALGIQVGDFVAFDPRVEIGVGCSGRDGRAICEPRTRMLRLLLFNWPVLAAAFIIGIATGRWMFRRRPNPEDERDQSSP